MFYKHCTRLLNMCFRNNRSCHTLLPNQVLRPWCMINKDFHTAAVLRSYDMRRVDFTPLEQRKLTFDTHALVKDLQASGFEKQQAEIIVTALVTLTTGNMDTVYRDMVTTSHQEIALQQIMAHLDAIRKDMVILEKSEFANLRAENEKIRNELEQFKHQLMEESMKIRADAKLDINLERSRVTDMFTEQEKKLMEVGTEFDKRCDFTYCRSAKILSCCSYNAMNADVDRSTTEATKKIDIEVASLKTLLESLKLDTIRYLAAFVFACLAMALGFTVCGSNKTRKHLKKIAIHHGEQKIDK